MIWIFIEVLPISVLIFDYPVARAHDQFHESRSYPLIAVNVGQDCVANVGQVILVLESFSALNGHPVHVLFV